jgi:hypothetical protein
LPSTTIAFRTTIRAGRLPCTGAAAVASDNNSGRSEVIGSV